MRPMGLRLSPAAILRAVRIWVLRGLFRCSLGCLRGAKGHKSLYCLRFIACGDTQATVEGWVLEG